MRNIQDALNEHKQAVIEYGIPEAQILGIFLYGSQNYGIDTEESDVDTKAIYIPTIEEAILNKRCFVKELHLANDEHCEVMDIRHLVDNFRKQNINFIEILYTKHYWINPIFVDLWEAYFVEKRDQIARYDMSRAVESIAGQALHTVKQNPKDGKKIANAWRLADFLDKYIHGVSYEDCMNSPAGTAEMLKMLKTMGDTFDNEEIRLRIEMTIERIRNEARTVLEFPEYSKSAIDVNMDSGIIALIRREDIV